MSIKRFIAKQLARPSGIFGRVVMGRWLNRMNNVHNALVLREMELTPADCVLEVGFGGGQLLGQILETVREGKVEGIELSDVMVSNARQRFRAAIDAGHMALHKGNASALPFADASFDKVCAVNTVYFWPELGKIVSELARVIRPGGRLVIGFTSAELIRRAGLDAYGFTPYTGEDLARVLNEGGFRAADVHTEHDLRGPCSAISAVRIAD